MAQLVEQFLYIAHCQSLWYNNSMNKKEIKQKAIFLREKGKTYSEIQNILKTKIAKSTLAYWCKNVKLPIGYEKRVRAIIQNHIKKARIKALTANREKRDRLLKSLEEKSYFLLKKMNKDVLKMLLTILYACEGSKWRSHRGLMLGNADPQIIKFYIKLLKTCYPEKINDNALRCRISYRADQNIQKLQKYWSELTQIPLNHFFKTKSDPRTIGKKTRKKDYKGVCVVSCGGTKIQLELETIAKIIFTKFQ